MASRIEDYALLGDTHSAALVDRNGSIDWLCWPRFDSPAVFAALVGGAENGHWSISAVEPANPVARSYRGDSLVLDTTFESEQTMSVSSRRNTIRTCGVKSEIFRKPSRTSDSSIAPSTSRTI